MTMDKPSLLVYIENEDEDFDLVSDEFLNVEILWSESEPEFVELVNEPGLQAPAFEKPESVTSVSFRVVSLNAESHPSNQVPRRSTISCVVAGSNGGGKESQR